MAAEEGLHEQQTLTGVMKVFAALSDERSAEEYENVVLLNTAAERINRTVIESVRGEDSLVLSKVQPTPRFVALPPTVKKIHTVEVPLGRMKYS